MKTEPTEEYRLSRNNREAIAQWAAKHDEIRRIYLFGGRAKGASSNSGDEDLAIEYCDGRNGETPLTVAMYFAPEAKSKLERWFLSQSTLMLFGLMRTIG